MPSKLGQTDEFLVVLNILEFALDADPSLLKKKVYMAIEEMGIYLMASSFIMVFAATFLGHLNLTLLILRCR